MKTTYEALKTMTEYEFVTNELKSKLKLGSTTKATNTR